MPEIAESPPAPVSTPEPPKKVILPPDAASINIGQKFRQELAKLQSTTPEPAKESPKVSPQPEVSPHGEKEEKSESQEAKVEPVTKPSSPLEAAIGKDKVEPVKDELSEFDKVDKPTSDHWSRARATMKKQNEELASLRSQPKGDPHLADTITTITKERDDLQSRFNEQENRLKSINAEYSEDYQNLIRNREGILTKIGTRVKSYGGNDELIMGALNLPDGKFKSQQIKEALSEVDADDKARIHTLIESLDGADEKILDFRKDLPARWEKIQKEQEVRYAEESAQHIKNLESNFNKVFEQAPKTTITLREVPDEVEGSTEWNQEIKSARETALNVLKPNGADFDQSVTIAIKGARYDSLEKRYIQLHGEYTEMAKRLAEYDRGGPDFKGGGKPSTEKKLTPAEKYHQTFRSLKGGGSEE
jgi:uncharacterized membrane-anchored protein YhcB (DUF1043 family)